MVVWIERAELLSVHLITSVRSDSRAAPTTSFGSVGWQAGWYSVPWSIQIWSSRRPHLRHSGLIRSAAQRRSGGSP